MTEAELLIEVKKGLGITGSYQDSTVLRHIKDTKAFALSAGVKTELLESDASVGLLIRGVADLWNLASGEVKFSTYFLQRLIQLATTQTEVPSV